MSHFKTCTVTGCDKAQSRQDLTQPHKSVNSQIKILPWIQQPVDSTLSCSDHSHAYAVSHNFLHKSLPPFNWESLGQACNNTSVLACLKLLLLV